MDVCRVRCDVNREETILFEAHRLRRHASLRRLITSYLRDDFYQQRRGHVGAVIHRHWL